MGDNTPVNLHGVLIPITTPFRNDEIDLDALRFNLERWNRTGVAGYVVLGSTGEAPYLDDDEGARVIAAARAAVPRDRAFVVGTGRESTRATMLATRRAADLGADAVLVRTPSYYRAQLTSDRIAAHFEAVADGSPVPVLLYNFPQVTGINLEPAVARRLARHQRILGIKDSLGDVGQVAALARPWTPEDDPGRPFEILVGSASTFYPSLCVGAMGGILAFANVAPEPSVRLHHLATTGQHEAARHLQARITPLAQATTTRFGIGGLKAAMDLAGFRGGRPRAPLASCPPAAIEELRTLLNALELLP